MRAIQFAQGEKIPNTKLCYIREAERTDPKRRRALFQCDCGNTIETDLNWVRFLNITSCGCYKSEYVSEKNTKHGHAVRGDKSGTYRSWQAMHQRVKANPRYVHVKICSRWYDFQNFYDDMGDRPDNHSIERKNNLGDYEPSNCKWATQLEQAQNMTQTQLITIGNDTHSISEWCRIKGIGYYLVKQRRKRGMSIEDAILTPVDLKKSHKRK